MVEYKSCSWLTIFVICIMFLTSRAMGAEEHWIIDKSDDGSVIVLEDKSVWRVDPADRVDSRLWLPGDKIVIPDSEDQLINTDDGEKVDAIRIR